MEQKCYNHPEEQAIATCHYCNRYLCSNCLVWSNEWRYYRCMNETDCARYQGQLTINDYALLRTESEDKNDILNILKDIHSAIETELRTVKRYGATSRINLVSGIKTGKEILGVHLYRFEMFLQRHFPDGSRGTLKLGNKTVDARVTMTEGQYIWLEVTEYLGKKIPQAYLEIDLSFLLEDMQGKYTSLINNGGVGISIPGKNLLVQNILNNPSYTFSANKSLNYLDYDQIKAIENTFSMEIGAIHGPPGTGKTRTLAGALIECFTNEEKVLVCGYTNRSVDEALIAFKKAAMKCVPNEFDLAFEKGRILRKGISVFREEEPLIPNPEEIINKLMEFLQQELDTTRNKIGDTKEALKYNKQLALDTKKRDQLQEQHDDFNLRIGEEEEKYKTNDGKIKSLSKRTKALDRECELITSSGFFKRVYQFKKKKSLEKQKGMINVEMSSISFEQSQILQKLGSLKIKLKDIEKDLSKTEPELKGIKTADLELKIAAFKEELEQLNRKDSDLERAIEEAPHRVINNALIIFATLSRSHIDKALYGLKFDRVFIDEASMASLPQLFLTCFKALKSIFVFGDPKQLAPICTSRKEEVRKWFAEDIYKYAGLDDQSKKAVSFLTKQRRMPIELGILVSDLFYGGQLEHEEKPIKQILPWTSDRKIVLLDTTDQGAFCNKHQIGQGYSRVNVVHAVISLNIFKEAEKFGLKPSEMAYITPYRAQAEFFGSLVLNNRKAQKDSFLERLRWGTVHRFQGGEGELIVYDTCESPRQNPTRLTGGNTKLDTEDIEIDDSARLHCVALSRAKSQLIILANVEWLKRTLPGGSKLSDIVDKISSLDSIVPVPTQHSASRLFSKALQKSLFTTNLDKSPYVCCDESNFYDLLRNDIESCKNNIIIVSPYLGESRLTYLESSFRLLYSKGVEVVVWTKDPLDLATKSEQHKKLAQQLKKLGVKIIFRPGTHEKAVIIDKIISYYGSLNPLSSINTRETMLRIKDMAFANTLINHLGIGDDNKKDEEIIREMPEEAQDHILKRLKLKQQDRIDKVRAKKVLKKLRWIIAEDKGLPVFATLYEKTIEWLINNKPKDINKLYSCAEFKRNKTNISGYEDVLFAIVNMIQ